MKLLLKFFSNSATKAYLRGLAQELGENTNAIRVELNRLSNAGLLMHEQEGNTVVYKANINNPFFYELHRLVMKYMGIDDIIDLVAEKIGDIELAFINGDYANGRDTGVIDLVLVGYIADLKYLNMLQRRGEEISNRKIRLLTLTPEEFEPLRKTLKADQSIILWASKGSGYRTITNYR